MKDPINIKPQLDRLYAHYNSRRWVHPDPLEYVYHYADINDQEIAGLIASSLAYGRVAQILKSVSIVLGQMGQSPYQFLKSATSSSLRTIFRDFRHRFTSGQELAMMLLGAKRVIEKYGSLYTCFLSGFSDNDETVIPALSFLVRELKAHLNGRPNSLLASPEKGSSCKRLHLFMRWMVRKDRVDPGGWRDVTSAKLIIPLDTHMHRIGRLLELTKRKSADIRTATEITNAFKKIDPDDPVRYDFALTRLGIRRDADLDVFLDEIDDSIKNSGDFPS
ncbi:MAG: TIGR02757 family protein [Desulfobacterales bacterium]|nr:TIGR02757 family protein [Desulfobacterales bacterium]